MYLPLPKKIPGFNRIAKFQLVLYGDECADENNKLYIAPHPHSGIKLTRETAKLTTNKRD